jgi:hypothetical protein
MRRRIEGYARRPWLIRLAVLAMTAGLTACKCFNPN